MTSRNFVVVMLLAALLAGCAEQPVGYLFEPEPWDQIRLTRTAAEVLDNVYEFFDMGSGFLESAVLTSDYRSFLPQGWLVVVDSLTGDTTYTNNFLDQKFLELRFDPVPIPGAIRIPSSLSMGYVEIGSFYNIVVGAYYGDTSRSVDLSIEYANNRQDVRFLDGWYQIKQSIPFTFDIEVSIGGGQSGTFTQLTYLDMIWLVRIEDFSVGTQDQHAKIFIEGAFPMLDEAGNYQAPHVSGEIRINSDGSGIGEMSLHGIPATRIRFRQRTSGFEGFFTLYSEDHKYQYQLRRSF